MGQEAILMIFQIRLWVLNYLATNELQASPAQWATQSYGSRCFSALLFHMQPTDKFNHSAITPLGEVLKNLYVEHKVSVWCAHRFARKRRPLSNESTASEPACVFPFQLFRPSIMTLTPFVDIANSRITTLVRDEVRETGRVQTDNPHLSQELVSIRAQLAALRWERG